MLAYGKSRSGLHYFLEWNFLCCPLTGILFVQLLSRWRSGPQAGLMRASVLAVVFLAALTGLPASLRKIESAFRLTSGVRALQDAQDSSAARVLKILEQTPGPVWCENMVLAMKAHKDIPIEPGIEEFLAKAGIWDETAFVHMISTQKFGVIIMRDIHNGFFTNATVRAIETNYAATEQIGDLEADHYTVFRPRPRGR